MDWRVNCMDYNSCDIYSMCIRYSDINNRDINIMYIVYSMCNDCTR